jgi:hypothetical protein
LGVAVGGGVLVAVGGDGVEVEVGVDVAVEGTVVEVGVKGMPVAVGSAVAAGIWLFPTRNQSKSAGISFEGTAGSDPPQANTPT